MHTSSCTIKFKFYMRYVICYIFLFFIFTQEMYGNESIAKDSIDKKTSADTLVAKTHNLKEVVVKGKTMIMKDGKTMIFPSMELKRNAYDGYSTLALMMIPGLSVDVVDKTIVTRGKNAMICINGRTVKADEISTLNPADIKRIDYYKDFDPAHPTAHSVIDFIMINRDYGGLVYFNGNQNLNVAKGNDLLDLKHYLKKSEFTVQVSDDYFHFIPSCGEESTTTMLFSDKVVDKTIKTNPSPHHANGLSGKLAYLYNGEKNMFQTAIYLGKKHDMNEKMMMENYNELSSFSCDKNHKDYTSVAIQLYFQRHTQKSILKTSLYTSYNKTNIDRDYKSLSEIKANTLEKYYYLSPSFLYGIRIGKHLPFIDTQYSYNNTRSNYAENANPFIHNKLIYGQGMFTLGDNIQVIPEKFKLTVQVMERIVTIDDGSYSSTKGYLTPSVFYDIYMPHNNSISGFFGFGVYDPQIKHFNSTEQTLDQYQILKGNVNLKNGSCFSAEITYNSTHNWGMVELYSKYENTSKAIFENVFLNDDHSIFVHHFENGGLRERVITNAALQLNLIPQKLMWFGGLEYDYSIERHLLSSLIDRRVVYETSLTYLHKNINGKITFSSPMSNLIYGTRIIEPMALKLALGYTCKQLHFTFNATNPFIRNTQKIEYLADNYKQESRVYKPRIGYNMLMIGVSYRLPYGKKHSFQNVEMNNAERSGILDYRTKNDK